jgi:DNA polymerase II large subunit
VSLEERSDDSPAADGDGPVDPDAGDATAQAHERYLESIEADLETARDVAQRARARGGDPTDEVEIPIAADMADRVEKVLGIDGVAERVRELEEDHSREEAALALVEDFVAGDVGDYDTDAGIVEGAVRTAVALLTEGVVAAPIEGIDGVDVEQNDDGTSFVRVYYAGPIRSAGGTAQALSVLVADYARTLLDIDEFRPRDDEIERYAEEVALYDEDTGLQYSPKDKETKHVTKNLPVMLDGEPTGDEEVQGFRDLERVDTNNPRGGMCLVLAEGIALKAPKIRRYTRDLEGLDWPWLTDLIEGTLGESDSEDGGDEAEASEDAERTDEADEDSDDAASGHPRPEPNEKYLRDLIAGRPVFGHPSAPGGFRLRYGRARNHGFATGGVHPATMRVLEDFLAAGTQLKTERPGKAHGVVPVDSIEGPTVRLANGEVRRIDDPDEMEALRNGVEAILDLGEYLVNVGEFVENNHSLAPASYTVEWWRQEFAAAGADVQAMEDDPRIDLADPDPKQAIAWASAHDAPLHPRFTYCWHDVDGAAFETLVEAVEAGRIVNAADATGERTDSTESLAIDATEEVREGLEALLLEHRVEDGAVWIDTWRPFVLSLGVDPDGLARTGGELDPALGNVDNAVDAVNQVAPFTVRERAPTRIGTRMGRPEKSEVRELSPAVHTLFPIGDAGGDQRDVKAATEFEAHRGASRGTVTVEVGRRRCPDCGESTYRTTCESCDARTEAAMRCPACGPKASIDHDRGVCTRCGDDAVPDVGAREIDVHEAYHDALEAAGERENVFEMLKGVKGLTSAAKTPEPMAKGVLRAKHGVSAFKDGTIRYDMTDLPVTAVRAAELDVSVDQLRELGYEEDVDGEPLRTPEQLVELKTQDVILSGGAAQHLLDTADFVDDLLEQYYGLEPFYELEERSDLVGELVFGMAPHTSAAVVGRIVGFTTAAVGYAHPYFHAAKRRNCFHPETKVWFEDEDGNWHHERIESMVEERLEDPDVDDFGTAVEELDVEVRVPSVDEQGRRTTKSVSAVSKHHAPDHLLEIETRAGRSLTVTPDHDLLRWEDGLDRQPASNVEEGDTLPSPKEIPVTGEEPEIDLLSAFIEADAIPESELMIRGMGADQIKRIFRNQTAGEEYTTAMADLLDVSTSTVYNWVGRDSVPVSVLTTILGASAVPDVVPDDVTLAIRRDTAETGRWLTVDDSMCKLLGYYVAEGFVRREAGSLYQTTICSPDESARDDILTTFEDALGIEASEENEWKITASSRLVATLFTDVLGAGGSAEEKQVPKCIFQNTDSNVQTFLAAYFSGDGSTSAERLDIRAHTTSGDLKTDLVAILKRFGIVAKEYRESRRPETGAVAEFYEGAPPSFDCWVLKISSTNAVRFAEIIGFDLSRKQERIERVIESIDVRPQRMLGDGGDVWLDEVVSVEPIEADVEYTYCCTVEDTHSLVANDIVSGQCDGDEDCVMLLMDGLLNFSKTYLPDQRGGKMDAPLVMSSRIDPEEIDDEAHNVDVVDEYPLAFYEATREMAHPETVDIELAEDSLGTPAANTGFGHTHDTSDIAAGPDLSAYKTLESMDVKTDAQLDLARRIRAVDESDVAERIIEYHFLPDLLGNLRSFTGQDVRCLGCGEKYRRPPLTGDCRVCGGNVNLTVHQGSVNKYMETAITVAEEYGARDYTKQRLQVLKKSLERLFEDDTNKQSGIADFM